ncbi:outer membrane protein assembly factor BamB [Acinetobacter sp. MD2]|uniref:outer membrane protein assembly factor BamB n=1 Tax=Acinetobacter sp. MD2 TaxID=2600066 RepID=UPI002D1EB5AE|nr:outer membrane protein assembly factor BamB [Acinetobacter sp. MD2]MEB3767069.1 outer membrane protein assembly factor BamB [Acinetobacter sp. MD2]
MDKKFILPFALTIVAAALVGCSSNKEKVDTKPLPLPKLVQSKQLVPVFSQSVAATNKDDDLRLQIAVDQGVLFIADPKGVVEAYKGKQRLWSTKMSNKDGLSAGVEAADGIAVVGNQKGLLTALDQATGQVKWTAQLSGSIIARSHIQIGHVITVTNDGNVYAHDEATGQQLWTYRLPNVPFSLRGQAAPVQLDPNNVLIATANAYVYGIDVVSGVPRLQRRVAVAEGRSDVQRLNDINPPVMMGQFMVTTSYQGQVTVTDLAQQQVVWSDDASSHQRPEVTQSKVFITTVDGKVIAYDLMSGQKLWENDKLLRRNLSNPVLLGSDLVVGDFDGVLSLIDPNTGDLIGRSSTKGQVSSLRVIDNQLYVSTQKGALSVWQNR